MPLDIPTIRSRFPALQRPTIFLDNPAGTQVAQPVLDRMNRYLVESNANQGGAFETSKASDAVIRQAREACADLYHADRPEEIVFGANMTTLTFHFSRALARNIQPGDRIVVTRLDHDANIAPWMQVAQDRGVELDWVDFDVENGTLKMESLEAALDKKPRIVAVGYASNALGTINPVKTICEMARQAGALTFIDAVQYAPHGLIDVQELGCDFLVASAYKFYGPHVGVLYGRYELLDGLQAYKVRPASDRPPGKWETGTGNFEGIAGVLGAVEYLAWVGEQFSEGGGVHNRREKLAGALDSIQAYERTISKRLITGLGTIPGVRVYGITDPERFESRVPTVAFTKEGLHPAGIAKRLGEAGIFVWSGNYYALAVTERLGLEESGGMVRVGGAHYNTLAEIERFLEAVEAL